jgi:hypothetical protein
MRPRWPCRQSSLELATRRVDCRQEGFDVDSDRIRCTSTDHSASPLTWLGSTTADLAGIDHRRLAGSLAHWLAGNGRNAGCKRSWIWGPGPPHDAFTSVKQRYRSCCVPADSQTLSSTRTRGPDGKKAWHIYAICHSAMKACARRPIASITADILYSCNCELRWRAPGHTARGSRRRYTPCRHCDSGVSVGSSVDRSTALAATSRPASWSRSAASTVSKACLSAF